MNLFFSQLYGELRKLFSRKRTYIGYVVFLVFELVILIVYKLENSQSFTRDLIERNGYSFDQYYTSLTVTYWVMSMSLFLLGSIYFALVSGDIVAKDVEDGNLRMILSRPVSRLRVLILKYLSTLIYTVTFVLFVGVTGYLMAIFAMGWDGGLFVWNYKMKVFAVFPEWGEGVFRLVIAALLIGVSMCTLSSVGFCFSCLPMKPAAATIMALSVLFVDFVLQEFPFFKPYEDLFITYRMSNWVFVLQNNIDWPRLLESYAFLLGINGSLFVIAWAVFQSRDFKT